MRSILAAANPIAAPNATPRPNLTEGIAIDITARPAAPATAARRAAGRDASERIANAGHCSKLVIRSLEFVEQRVGNSMLYMWGYTVSSFITLICAAFNQHTFIIELYVAKVARLPYEYLQLLDYCFCLMTCVCRDTLFAVGFKLERDNFNT
jgi:hypothetical protein